MNNVEEVFRAEIEVERMRAAMGQAKLVFVGNLPFIVVLAVVLWDNTSRPQLLFWLSAITSIHFFRWFLLHSYHTQRKALNPATIPRVKLILAIGSVLAGSCWGVTAFSFADPAQPYTVLVMVVIVMFVSAAAAMSWFVYLPAVLAFMLPIMGCWIGFFCASKKAVSLCPFY